MYYLIYHPIDNDYFLVDTDNCLVSDGWYSHPEQARPIKKHEWATSVDTILGFFYGACPQWPLRVVAQSSTLPFSAERFPELRI